MYINESQFFFNFKATISKYQRTFREWEVNGKNGDLGMHVVDLLIVLSKLERQEFDWAS